ncbi:MAG: hypothetical protein JO148_08545 [Acidimicrobiia bacterium]|nr:hypothetical protein [Acidimicrobiia bacterium]
MADTDEGAEDINEETAEAETEVDIPDEAPVADTVSGPEVGRTELKVMRARLTLEEQAEEARRRVLGTRRARYGPATAPSTAVDDDVDLNERLRELVRSVEEETDRLHDDVTRLRSSAGRAGATLQNEIQRAATELAEASAEQLETTVGQSATESLAALTAAVDSLQETAASLNNVAAGLLTSVERLGKATPVAERLAELADAPPSIPDALATILSDLTDQLSALGDAVTLQVRSAVEEALATELGRHEARTEHALARIVDEMARLRRRLPVAKKGAPIELSKDQLTAIGESVGDYLLAAMREQKS